jgi:hypothetical protein
MNAVFELPQAEVIWRREPLVGIGPLKAIDMAEKSLEKGLLKAVGR